MPETRVPESHDYLNKTVPTDGGPWYPETNLDAVIAEPWNTVTASLFILLALAWLWRLRGRYRQFPFMTICQPILLAGGIGGTVYHATRSHPFWLRLDYSPIYLLGLAASIYLWTRLRPRWWMFFLMVTFLGFTTLLFPKGLDRQWTINLSYASVAMLILIPLTIVMIQTRFRFWAWILTAFCCFTTAWMFRIIDAIRPTDLPMGTHWLWHIFGCMATAALAEYFYRLEAYSLRPAPRVVPDSPDLPPSLPMTDEPIPK